MPPDAILCKEFSQMTDVWSYGIVVWEIFSLGNRPFDDLVMTSAREFADWLMQGRQMARPKRTPLSV